MSLLAEPFDRKRLNEALSSSRFPDAHLASKSRIDYLEDHLKGLAVASMVTEDPYTDGEYLEDFAAYYAKCHAEYPRLCKRIHFFSTPKGRPSLHEPGTLDALIVAQDDKLLSDYQAAYLGFVVARPLPETVIGRTALKHWPEIEGNKLRMFPLLPSNAAHLLGLEFSVGKSLAFQEQDSACGACATVALWSAIQQASKLFGTSCPRPATITQLASPLHAHVLGRTLPSHGLSVLQMCNAIRATGLEPEVFRLRTARGEAPTVEWLSLIQGYVAASVPVIVIGHIKGREGLHAVTVCGLGHDAQGTTPRSESGEPPPITLSGSRLRALYVHDDQRGPYCHYYPTDALAPTDRACLREYADHVPQDRRQRVLEPIYAIVPIYGKVRISYLDIQRSIAGLSAILEQLLGTAVLQFEWDIQLALSNDLKTGIRRRLSDASEYRDILQSPLPRFIWVTKLTASDKVLWEILWDATDTPRSVPIIRSIWLSLTVKETLVTRLADFLSRNKPLGSKDTRQSLIKWFIDECYGKK